MVSSSGIVKRIRLGDECLTYCGRCKEERQHQVSALDSQGQIEQVTCRTCHYSHLYRANRPNKQQKVVVRTPARQALRSQGRSARDEHDLPETGETRDYSPSESYATGELISHPKFGAGRVVTARAGKIDVRFGREVRTLLHAG